jgi:hypothetical protein
MPIKIKRKNGDVTRYKNVEYKRKGEQAQKPTHLIQTDEIE